ncbi:hypothetical protein NQ318_015964 [Aromia moschata]|uniref:DNA-directed DNA polymerase n=1 Tax=Aromia moschata TaxID=1265417 RepID=A0AAV8X4Q1_9CUCU|nr:hypothetical protein NQ318_015964 [Aromia moschata]
MGEAFNKDGVEKYIMYYDINNLYGAGMSYPLPEGEVDIEYPVELHELHKDLPMCPEQMVPPGSKNSKLMTTLLPKSRYVIHYRSLQRCLDRDLRKQATNDFEKNFYKLMNNSVFSKTMESVRKYKDVKLVTRWEGRFGAKYYISQPNFHSLTQFGDDMIILKIMCTAYPRLIKKVLSLMKDENHGEIMTEFIGLRAKMYTYKVNHESVYKRIKGLTRPAIKRITFEDFRNCLFNKDTVNKEHKLIRSQKHTLYTIKQNKLALSPYDDKRIINYINTDTKPWGYDFQQAQTCLMTSSTSMR